VVFEQDSGKENFEEETIQLSKGKQKPSTQRGGHHSTWIKQKAAKKKNKASKSGKGQPGQ
jgi:hypothetical protein